MTTEGRTSAKWSRWLAATVALFGLSFAASGCIEDSDCGICDPDNLVLESISGINYAQRKVHVLNPTCEGADCPAPFDKGSYFIEDIGPCEETEDALESPRGPEEYCKIAPLVTAFGIEFVFNNLLDPTSVELVRKRPDNPQLFEVYDWKNRVVEVQGPITRYNGDFFKGEGATPDQISRLVNLSCVDNLRDQGIAFDNESYEDPATNPCNTAPGGVPLKMRAAEPDGSRPKFKSYGGIWGSFGNSCDTPEDGADTCCSRCDYLLSTQVAKYGLTADGTPRTPHLASAPPPSVDCSVEEPPEECGNDPQPNAAIRCDPTLDDKYIACAAFVPWVNRAEQEQTFRYEFCADGTCEAADHPLPYYDQLRSLHPDQRPEGLERRTAKCVSDAQCTSSAGHNLPGTECVGTTPDGQACSPERTADCENAACVAEWFVKCSASPDTTGELGYCVDKRFSDRGAGACFRTVDTGTGGMTYDGRNYGSGQFPALCNEEIKGCQKAPAGTKLAFCDQSEDGALLADECCWPSLQGGMELADGRTCDPLLQNVTPVSTYERNENLPETTRDCRCELPAAEGCDAVVEIGCLDSDGNLRPERAGQYAVKFVTRAGGVVYDPAVKGFEWRPADLGGVPRADIEACAESRGLIDDRNIEDGWRANDAFLAENFEEFDRAMCSGQEYRVVFNGPDAPQFVQDKVGNTLEGKSEYVFQTPQFHVVPGSGFPTDNLRIGACDKFSIRFSNKYDMSPENVAKLQIWSIDENGAFVELVAGGAVCATTQEEAEAKGLPPCLTPDIENQGIGELAVEIDPAEFGPILATGGRYRLYVPGLNDPSEAADPVAYQNAFWDACGMPLILGGLDEGEPADYLFDFTIDPPQCKEDQDTDQIQLSCDNAPDFYNPDQGDVDSDGVGDVIDLCPTVPTSTANSADSDRDGIGNECDTCRQTINQYNEDEANPPDYMLVRNIPFQEDTDGDGIGDVCDNCVHVANCDGYGSSSPWQPGDPIAYDDDNLCQQDNDRNMVGDACAPADENDFDPAVAAGPVGIGAMDDFDQDGLANSIDGCPRQPVERIECTSDAECPEFTRCETDYGVCNHLDQDGDGLGDICDSCPTVQNPNQDVDGFAQEDDDDGDFVGKMCETNSQCEFRADPRPFGFYAEAANGQCCTVQLVEQDDGTLARRLDVPGSDAIELIPLADPDGLPIRLDCDDTSGTCRKLPSAVASRSGVLELPAGCEGVDPDSNRLLTIDDVGGDPNALWDQMCFLPQFDQDFDGLGDICDLCSFDFDPQNLPYIDANGKVWPDSGKYCNGDYKIENNKARCPDDGEPEPTGGSGGSDGGSGGMESGGMDTGGTGGDVTGG